MIYGYYTQFVVDCGVIDIFRHAIDHNIKGIRMESSDPGVIAVGEAISFNVSLRSNLLFL